MTEPRRGIAADVAARIAALVDEVDAGLAARYPGDRPSQPVHTVYVGADVADPDTPRRWGAAALELLEAHRPLLAELGGRDALDLTAQRLASDPVEDLRLDFEDGYGRRPDASEDADARRAGRTLTELDTRRCGIRVKGLTTADRARTMRTLELVLDAAGGVPDGFVVTYPKLRAVGQVDAAVLLCRGLEQAHGLPERTLHFELQIESPQAVLAADGTAAVARMVHAADGRCVGLHYGTYDYSAACGITPLQQSLTHPVADHAKAVMLAAAAQTGVQVVDGSTQVAPVGTDEQVAAALRRHAGLVTHALERGYFQGWDMHPGHLVTRWLATIAFFRAALPAAAPRLQSYLQPEPSRGPASVVDEPATARALAMVVVRGLGVGAFTDDDVRALAPAADPTTLLTLTGGTPR